MKRSGKSNEQVQKFPKTASPKADSRAVVVNKTQAQVDELSLITRNQEELVYELSLITRQATGTQSHDVADRIIEQVTGVHVWPRPKDAMRSFAARSSRTRSPGPAISNWGRFGSFRQIRFGSRHAHATGARALSNVSENQARSDVPKCPRRQSSALVILACHGANSRVRS